MESWNPVIWERASRLGLIVEKPREHKKFGSSNIVVCMAPPARPATLCVARGRADRQEPVSYKFVCRDYFGVLIYEPVPVEELSFERRVG